MIDAITQQKQINEFSVWAASSGFDLACCISGVEGVKWFSPMTTDVWNAYRMGRMHESKAAALPLVLPVRSSTDWQSVNAIARNSG